jgi:hypothetical protein
MRWLFCVYWRPVLKVRIYGAVVTVAFMVVLLLTGAAVAWGVGLGWGFGVVAFIGGCFDFAARWAVEQTCGTGTAVFRGGMTGQGEKGKVEVGIYW